MTLVASNELVPTRLRTYVPPSVRVTTFLILTCFSVKGFTAAQDHPVKAELIAEHTSIQPLGTTRVGVHFEIEPGWHIYAEDPGDAGLPTKIGWWGSAPVLFEPIQWPLAEDFTDAGDIHTHGYSGNLVLASSIKVGPGASVGDTLDVNAHVEWLACREICLPGKADLALTLPVTQEPSVLSAHAELFDQIRGE